MSLAKAFGKATRHDSPISAGDVPAPARPFAIGKVKAEQSLCELAGASSAPCSFSNSEFCADGQSLMTCGEYLNPQVNTLYCYRCGLHRVFNLARYCSPGWNVASSGNFELRSKGPKFSAPTTFSRFHQPVIRFADFRVRPEQLQRDLTSGVGGMARKAVRKWGPKV
jgi:hypothetical protein